VLVSRASTVEPGGSTRWQFCRRFRFGSDALLGVEGLIPDGDPGF
jgi:hypothetical protein